MVCLGITSDPRTKNQAHILRFSLSALKNHGTPTTSLQIPPTPMEKMVATLPAEVVQLIVALIRDAPPPKKPRNPFGNRAKPAKLAQYAIVSRQWQAIVERMIWQQITINKKGSLEYLKEFTSGDFYRRARAGYIRHILWSPEIDRRDLYAKTQGGDDVRVQVLPDWYLQQYQSSIFDLFELLDAWKDHQTNMELSLWLSDDNYLDVGDDEEIEQEEWGSLTIDQLWRKGKVPNFLHLTADDIQNLPTLPYITCFRLHEVRDSNVQPSAFFRFLSCFTHVQHVSSGEGRFVPRGALQALADQRQEVVDHLSLVPESVETFTYSISAKRELSINPAHNAANYLSSQGLDDLSIAFRSLSTRLRELHLEGIRISSALFWPVAEEMVDTKSLYWPNLEVLKVLEAPPYTADGKWILDNDPEKDWEGDLEEDSFEPWQYDSEYYAQRGLIKSYEVDQLYESMGLAVQRMPLLRELKFSFRGEIGERGSHEYLEFKRDLTTGKTTLKVSTEWEYKMGEKITSAWGLKDEKANEFRETWSVSLDQWP